MLLVMCETNCSPPFGGTLLLSLQKRCTTATLVRPCKVTIFRRLVRRVRVQSAVIRFMTALRCA